MTRRPTVSITKPMRDVRATNVEEVFSELKAEDDIGMGKLELHYSVNGGEEKSLTLYNGKPRQQSVTGSHTFFLEEFGLQPGDVVSYYGKATDNNNVTGPGTSSTDIYFIQIRPFEQKYTQSQQGGEPGGDGQRPGGPQQAAEGHHQRDLQADPRQRQDGLEGVPRQPEVPGAGPEPAAGADPGGRRPDAAARRGRVGRGLRQTGGVPANAIGTWKRRRCTGCAEADGGPAARTEGAAAADARREPVPGNPGLLRPDRRGAAAGHRQMPKTSPTCSSSSSTSSRTSTKPCSAGNSRTRDQKVDEAHAATEGTGPTPAAAQRAQPHDGAGGNSVRPRPAAAGRASSS